MHAIRTENFSSVEITTEHDLWVWLSNNFGSKDSVWLITYKKSTPQKYLSREQVLDALIAYGWIDGIRRKLDDQRTMQLISQRKTQSWSATYKQRADRLEAEGRMQKQVATQFRNPNYWAYGTLCRMLTLWLSPMTCKSC
jgi:hypothetical protein